MESALVLALILLVVLYFYTKRPSSHYAPLPPGPKKLPLIGNLLDMPTTFEWETYDRWCKELGELLSHCLFRWTEYCGEGSDIIHLEVAGTSIVVMNSAEVAEELLDQHSAIHSDRYDMGQLDAHLIVSQSSHALQTPPGHGERVDGMELFLWFDGLW